MAMAFFKGPKPLNPSLGNRRQRWVMGALFLAGHASCWSLWLILQVPICKWYIIDPLTLSARMCLLSTWQPALLTSLLLPDMAAWRIRSLFDVLGCILAGVFGSGVTFYLQSWCVSVRGPVYSAMFNPLCTVITTIVAAIIRHEELHVGSLMGAAAIVAGLYIVLWGKAGDGDGKRRVPELANDLENTVARPESQLDDGYTIREPLLVDGHACEK